MTEVRTALMPSRLDEMSIIKSDVFLNPVNQLIKIKRKKERIKMDKKLKKQLSGYLKEVQRKVFSNAEILKMEEISVIYGYTEEWYESLNEGLRKKNGEIETEFGKELDCILAKLPNFEGLVFRGASLNSKHLSIYEEADKYDLPIEEPIFLSTSKRESIARMYIRYSRDSHQVLFKIFSKQGKDIESYSKYGSQSGQNEREILFRPNSRFEIVDIDKSHIPIIITLNEIIKNGAT